MREHEKTAGGSRKGKKSRRRGFLFSSLCRPLSSLMLSDACVLCVCCVCVRVSNILCDGESSLYKRRYRPGIVCMFFRSHITHHTPPRRICAHSPHISHQRPRPRSELFKNISISIETARTHTLYTINYYCIPFAPPPPPGTGRGGNKINK